MESKEPSLRFWRQTQKHQL